MIKTQVINLVPHTRTASINPPKNKSGQRGVRQGALETANAIRLASDPFFFFFQTRTVF